MLAPPYVRVGAGFLPAKFVSPLAQFRSIKKGGKSMAGWARQADGTSIASRPQSPFDANAPQSPA